MGIPFSEENRMSYYDTPLDYPKIVAHQTQKVMPKTI